MYLLKYLKKVEYQCSIRADRWKIIGTSANMTIFFAVENRVLSVPTLLREHFLCNVGILTGPKYRHIDISSNRYICQNIGSPKISSGISGYWLICQYFFCCWNWVLLVIMIKHYNEYFRFIILWVIRLICYILHII